MVVRIVVSPSSAVARSVATSRLSEGCMVLARHLRMVV
jgi:hypothetical protein